ncbi:MAG TPA: NADPH-dependent oxidoreductase [Rhodocyclaceae bacterium]
MSDPTAALKARYQSATLPEVGPWNEVLELLLAHRSVRAYTPEPLAEGTLESLMAAAQSASTSSNLQAWSVIAVTDQERKQALCELCGQQRQIPQAPLFLVWLADLHRLEQVAAYRGEAAEALPYLEMLTVAVIDAALAAQNFVVAAESLGLGTVYIGALRNHVDQVAALMELPPNVMPVFGMCVGHIDPARPGSIRPRLEQGAVLFRETYGKADPAPALQRYDEVMSRYYAEQKIKAPNSWTGHSAERISHPGAMSGRHLLRGLLEKMGFGLR